jgi:hypothetical protein
VQTNATQFQKKQHDLLNDKVENNTIMEFLTYKINPGTWGWRRGKPKYISVSE